MQKTKERFRAIVTQSDRLTAFVAVSAPCCGPSIKVLGFRWGNIVRTMRTDVHIFSSVRRNCRLRKLLFFLWAFVDYSLFLFLLLPVEKNSQIILLFVCFFRHAFTYVHTSHVRACAYKYPHPCLFMQGNMGSYEIFFRENTFRNHLPRLLSMACETVL